MSRSLVSLLPTPFVVGGRGRVRYETLVEQPGERFLPAELLFDAEVNVVGSLNLPECVGEYEARKVIYIYISSGGAVYGEPRYLPCTAADCPSGAKFQALFGVEICPHGDAVNVLCSRWIPGFVCLFVQHVTWNRPITVPWASFQARIASGVGSNVTRHCLRSK